MCVTTLQLIQLRLFFFQPVALFGNKVSNLAMAMRQFLRQVQTLKELLENVLGCCIICSIWNALD